MLLQYLQQNKTKRRGGGGTKTRKGKMNLQLHCLPAKLHAVGGISSPSCQPNLC